MTQVQTEPSGEINQKEKQQRQVIIKDLVKTILITLALLAILEIAVIWLKP